MRICFDVNAVLYLFADEGYGFRAAVAYDIANIRKHEVAICASCLADINYLLHRLGVRGANLQRNTSLLFELFDVMDVNREDGIRALDNGMSDYEDALIAESAYRHNCDLIVTENVKDFGESPVPAITLEEYTRIYKPCNYEYDEVDFS